MTSIDMLNALKAKYGLIYDKDVANMLQLSTTFISKIRRNEKIFGSNTILKMADLLDLELDYIARCAMAERAKPVNQTAWLSGTQRI